MKKFLVVAAMIAAFGLGGAAAFAASSEKPPSPPGQPNCEHGNATKPCKDDPQPDHGKDCEEHGNSGGQNEDHCKNETTPTETTPTETTPTETTPTETTPTVTTPTTETTPNGGGSNPSTPSTPSAPESPAVSNPPAAPEAPATPEPVEAEEEDQPNVFTPPSAKPSKTVEVASANVAAPKPTKAPQAPPFTP